MNIQMADQIKQFLESLIDTCWNISPIIGIILGFQFLIIRKPLPHPRKILIGLIYILFGITFFLQGLQMALFPLGKFMATQLTAPNVIGLLPNTPEAQWQAYTWVYLFAACIGFATTLAEPALFAVAAKVQQISGGAIHAWGLRLAVSLGVAIGISVGAFRIITGLDIYYFMVSGYVIVLIQAIFAPKVITGLAFDSGAVTTSTVTVPLVTALGLGLANTVPGRNPLIDGFGLIAFANLFSIISVLLYALLAEWWSKNRFSS